MNTLLTSPGVAPGLPGTAVPAKPGSPPGRAWRDRYAGFLAATDGLVLVWVVFGVQVAWFGIDAQDVKFRGSESALAVNYGMVSIAIVIGWMLMLHLYGTRDHRVLGTGPEEYKLIINASVRVFALVALGAYLFQVDVARGYILIALPFGVLALLLWRWLWRQWLGAQRRRGRFSSTVLLVGSERTASHIAQELGIRAEAGYRVVGACVPAGTDAERLPGTDIPVLGDFEALHVALARTGADTVVITSSDELPPERIRKLSWSLEPGRQHLVMAPSLIDIGGPRIHTRPVTGLPLIHVETPRYEGRKLFTKRAFDVVASSLIILMLSPFLIITALLVRFGSAGPILFRQERVGINGRHFEMLKFRSMVPNADKLLVDLQKQDLSEGNGVMFKMKNDPRVTRVGGFLRRFSLDELPQLFNVFRGSMSLVGPRPPLEREVHEYEHDVHRRFLVKPGITGLWQVSGRSNLSWSDTVRLDLYYVENWSITGDLVILWRTAKAVVASEGAY